MPEQSSPTIIHLLQKASERTPDKTALIDGKRTLTYSQYFKCVMHFVGELNALGVSEQRVAVLCANSLDMVIALFAVQAAGAQVVPLNPLYTASELHNILSDAEPTLVIFDEELSDDVEPLLTDLNIKHKIVLGSNTGRHLDEKKDKQASEVQLPDPNALTILQYTGGTTGLSKGVNITHTQTITNIRQRNSLIPLEEDKEIVLCVMPLFHVFASSMCLYAAVYARATLVIERKFHPQSALQALQQHRVTVLPAAPTVLISLMGHEDFDKTDFSSLKLCFSGAAPLPEETLKQWQNSTGTKILEGYGQTESGPVLSFNPLHGLNKSGSVGIPVPDTDIQIVDLEMGKSILPENTPGEIRAFGPQIMSGYRNRPEETKEALRDGWLYTGDIGCLDEDGYLYILDRKKDMIIVGGYNVYPREIDELLLAHDDIVETATVGASDSYYGERVISYVVLSENTKVSSENLREYCGKHLAKFKVPSEIIITESLPKTPVGKIDKKAIRALKS